jgi:hypothetical protein
VRFSGLLACTIQPDRRAERDGPEVNEEIMRKAKSRHISLELNALRALLNADRDRP